MNYKLYFFTLFLLCSFTVFAEEITPYKKHSITILWENDFLNFLKSDRYYSNGVRIGYTSKEYDYSSEDNSMSWGKNVSITNYNKPHLTRYHISINQEMYTPSGHGPTIAQNDHIHGGFLYLNAGIYNRTENTLEHIGIKTGITGPYSFAGALQTALHSGTNQLIFQEWHQQVDTEFIFNPYYQWIGRAYFFKTKGISMDILGTLDIALGNADTHFGSYGNIRIGYNLDNDFGMPRMTLEQDGSSVHSDKFSIYLFLGGGGRVTLHNLFVTGNSELSDRGYNFNLLRWEVTTGLVMSYMGVRIGYTWTYYSRDYIQQPYNHHAIGSLLVEFAF